MSSFISKFAPPYLETPDLEMGPNTLHAGSAETQIPRYTIDLALPPHLRYIAVAQDFAPKMRFLTSLFDEILESITSYVFVRRMIKFLAGVFLFRVFSREEMQELKGIAKTTGVEMYLLVALNVLLDTMLGCTSGGVLTAPKGAGGEARMMHFRTLDWGMDGLREVLVQLDFINSKSEEPEKILASTITYAGFVGVLTGVRPNLSISLNF
ncbi:Acid ceramidase, partial [Lachnellula suecica]